MLPVLQWPEDGNNFRNPRQMSLSCLGGAFLFMVEMKNKRLLLFLLFCVACSDMGTNPKEEEIPETVSYKNDIQPYFIVAVSIVMAIKANYPWPLMQKP